MSKNLSKFIAFAAAHPKLLGRSSLFGAVNEDHTAFKLFVEYIKKEKFIYHGLPTNIGIAEFKGFILTQDAAKYQEIIDKIDNLHLRGYLRDQQGSRDLYDLAVIFDELGLDALDPRFAESSYNQLLLDSYSYKPANQVEQATRSTQSVQSATPQVVAPKPISSEDTANNSFYAGTTAVTGAASATNASVSLDQSRNSTIEAVSQYPLSRELPTKDSAAPLSAAVPDTPLSSATPIIPAENDLPVLTEPVMNKTPEKLPDLSGIELKSSEVSGTFKSTNTTTVPKTKAVVGTRQPAARRFNVPTQAKGGQNIRFLDTVTGLRQREGNKPNFAQNRETQGQAGADEGSQFQQPGNPQSEQQGRREQNVKKFSPGKKLMGRVFKSFAGLGGAFALIPNTSASAAVLKKAITIALFSLLIVANVPLFADSLHSDSYTAYAADPAAPAADPAAAAANPAAPAADPAANPAAAPAAGLPAASCPAPFTAVDGSSCSLDPATPQTVCPPEFPVEQSREGTKLTCKAAQATNNANPELEKLSWILDAVMKFFNAALWPILVMIGGLMDNSLLFGSGMEERLRDIWIPMRNLVNILFVIVLVGVALYNVLGIGGDDSSYSIKSILPKIVVGIIAVNFSFLGIKVALDATNAITTSIFALPADVNIGLDKVLNSKTTEGQMLEKKICASIHGSNVETIAKMGDGAIDLMTIKGVAYKYFKNKISQSTTQAQIDELIALEEAKGAGASITKEKFDKEVADTKAQNLCNGLKLTDKGKEYLEDFSSRNAAMAMAINMGGIVFYNDVKLDVDNLDKLFINALFSTVMYIIYVASFVALFIILLGRLLVMWLCVAMSPLLILVMFSSELKDKVGAFGKLEEQFTKNAIAPIIVAISMTVGWIMLNALKGLNSVNNASVSLYSVIPNNGVPVAGLDTLGDFIVALGTIGVVWLGVFGAAEGTVAQGAVDMIGNGLKSAGKFIGTAPLKHLNVVPIKLPGSAENYSMSEVAGAIQHLASEKPNRLVQLMGDKGFSAATFADKTVIPNGDVGTFYKGINKAAENGDLSKPEFINMLSKLKDDRKDIYEKLSTGTQNAIKALVTAKGSPESVEALRKTTDKETGKSIASFGKDIDTSVKKPPTPPAPGTPGAPSTPGASSAVPVAGMNNADVQNLPIGDTTVGKVITENNLNADSNITALKTAATSVSSQLAEITSPAAATPEQKEALESRFEELHIGENGDYPKDQSQLAGFIGADNAKKLIDIYGGQAGYATMVDKVKQEAQAAREAEEAKKREKESNPDLAASD